MRVQGSIAGEPPRDSLHCACLEERNIGSTVLDLDEDETITTSRSPTSIAEASPPQAEITAGEAILLKNSGDISWLF